MIDCPGPFNVTAINNRGAAAARGDILGLVHNDIEISHRDWLSEMVGELMRPGVGAVGAKLLYPDGRLQHAGIILGIGGVAGHAFKYAPAETPGYFGRAQLVQALSAVSGA